MLDFQDFCRIAEDRLFIIAEAGVNHDGSLARALELVDAAQAAGCDAIKFQTWITEKVYSQNRSMKPDYQLAATDPAESEFDTIKSLELSFTDFRTIKEHCDRRGIMFFSTPDESDSAEFLVELGMPLMKTASQDVTNLPFLRHVAQLGLPVIYSTGACTMTELVAGAEAIRQNTPDLAILHCVSCYPAPAEDMNLTLIPLLKGMFGGLVGLSDHTPGLEMGCAAVALGARLFEKHLTLDRNLPGPDHQASLEPDEMARYVRALRDVRVALGDGHKRVMPSEKNVRLAFRRFIVAAHDLPAGHRLTAEDILFKKVVDGLAPASMDLVIGALLKGAVAADTPLTLNLLAWDDA